MYSICIIVHCAIDLEYLILAIYQHGAVRVVSDVEQMRGHFILLASLILLDDVHAVDGQAAVRVDGDTEETGVRLQSPRKQMSKMFYSNVAHTLEWN